MPGQIAWVRQRLYLVEEVLPARNSSENSIVKLSCVDDDNQGEPLEVLWECELDAKVQTAEGWDSVAAKGFDEPKLFAAFLHTLRWNCVTATDPKLFQSPFRAGIRIDAYQLEPLRMALQLPRVNLFIADDVGLGKTIEAGLIARELLLRKKVREIVVSCPPSMLQQWKEELEIRFGLTFEILDKNYFTQVRRQRGFAINPWTTHSRFLISHRLLIDETYMAPMREWLLEKQSGTLLILDEAHHAAPSSGQHYAIESRLTKAVRELASLFEHKIFLSATPHNGHSNSFSTLLEILDPQRFIRGVPVSAKMRDEVLVRRLKEDIREVYGGFPTRRVKQLDISGLPTDSPELKLFVLLDEYRLLREERLADQSKKIQASSALLLSGLQQRLLSSIEAFSRTLRVHRRTVKKQWERTQEADSKQAKQIKFDLISGSIGNDDDRATLSEEELNSELELQTELASISTFGTTATTKNMELFSREQNLLDEMSELADTSSYLPDGRIRKLIDWIRKEMCPDLGRSGAMWNNTRIIIFTEYDDTKRYIREQLARTIQDSDKADQRILIYHGPTAPAQREEIKHAFNSPPEKHPVRILIATDAAREGLNLQAHCWNLFHFDVPWNPSRMEQRNGRIDRKLQPNDEVFCHYFVYTQRPEDRILVALVRKTETIRRELGSLSNVIDSSLAKKLQFGIQRNAIEKLEEEITKTDLDLERRAVMDEELESSRIRQKDLQSSIDRLRIQLEDSQKNVGLTERNFRSAISCALQLLRAEPLKSLESSQESAGLPQFLFPDFEQGSSSDSSWANTMDTLRAPKKSNESLWDWRRSSPIRPIVFQDTGTMTDEVVHLHLEHRVVKRLLNRFTAQGFIHNELSRSCLTQTTDAIPRVALVGRLSLYGNNAARLHEELVFVTAKWTDLENRKQPLAPYAKDAEAKTLELLEEALESHSSVPIQIAHRLQASASQDIAQLLPYLQGRGEEYALDATTKLMARATKESNDMHQILETQKKHIAARFKKYEKDLELQLRLGVTTDKNDKTRFTLPEDEQRQIEADKRHWSRRLEGIEHELGSEPARVRQVYEVKASRVEPVGIVYLWPITG